MTDISTIYDALVTRLTALYPSHKRITNPYVLNNNNDQFLAQGWGLATRDAENTNRELSRRLSVRRNFDVVLTRRYFAKDLDLSKVNAAEKNLLEDLQLLIDSVEGTPDLSVTDGKYIVKYNFDSGITAAKDDRDDFLAIIANVSVEYFRTIP